MSLYKIFRAELNDENGNPIQAKDFEYEEVLIHFGNSNGVEICFNDENQANLARTYLSEADPKGYYKIITVRNKRKTSKIKSTD